jgi:hypothetical protein
MESPFSSVQMYSKIIYSFLSKVFDNTEYYCTFVQSNNKTAFRLLFFNLLNCSDLPTLKGASVLSVAQLQWKIFHNCGLFPGSFYDVISLT